jgi:hypothetical protein
LDVNATGEVCRDTSGLAQQRVRVIAQRKSARLCGCF